MSGYNVRFNPQPRITTVALGGDQQVLVIDDVLDHPEQLVRLAQDVASEFVQVPGNAFPGAQLLMPPNFSARLDDFFRLHIRGLLGGRRSLQMYSRLSRVTMPPSQLDARQRICHRDSVDIADGHTISASVLYLFDQPSLGGTVFFRPRGSDEQTEQLVADANTLNGDAFEAKYDWPASYITRSNAYFELIGQVPARWNRIIFYDGRIFHSSDITDPQGLNDPQSLGRLTVNGFFTCTRRAA